jgi:hypothetical protein
MSLYPLDGPTVEDELSVTTTPVELKVSTSAYEERKVVTFEAQDGRVRWGFTNGITPTKGFIGFKNRLTTIEAAASQSVWIVAESGTVKVYLAERA